MRTLLAWSLLDLAVCDSACSASSSDAPGPTLDGATVDADRAESAAEVASEAASDDAAGEASLPYPAFRPSVPKVTSGGGPVMTAPKIVPVVFPDTAYITEVTDYVPKAVASSAWSLQVTEYGVGAGTVAPVVTATALPTADLTLGDLETFVRAQVQSGAWGAADTTEFGTSLYVLFLPPGVTITLPTGKVTCPNLGGFHRELTNGTTHVPYGVVVDCGKGLAAYTRTAWHEIVEAVTDPFAMPHRGYGKTLASWVSAFTGGEVGDMCEHRKDANVTPPDIGYTIQRNWSNVAAQAYHDPCVPSPAAPYFNAAPVLPDMVSLGMATVPGVKIAVGASKTIDVQLFSDGPTAPFTVGAREPRGGTTLGFAWDKTTGTNGDVLHLTITANAAAAGGTTFIVTSSLGTASGEWVGAVAN